MPQERPCPIGDQPTNEGGHMDASIGKQEAPVFQFRYTPEQSTGDPHARCAFLALSQQALAHQLTHQKIDRTLACHRCGRAVRVRAVNSSLCTAENDERGEQPLHPMV